MKRALLLVVLVASVSYGQIRVLTSTLIRPTNATTYASGDAMKDTSGKIQSFTYSATPQGGEGFICAARIWADTANVTNAQFRLYLYNDSTGITIPADNAAFITAYANRAKGIGYIDFSLQMETGANTGAMDFQSNLNIPFKTKTLSSKLYGILLAKGAYVPKNGGAIYMELITLKTQGQ